MGFITHSGVGLKEMNEPPTSRQGLVAGPKHEDGRERYGGPIAAAPLASAGAALTRSFRSMNYGDSAVAGRAEKLKGDAAHPLDSTRGFHSPVKPTTIQLPRNPHPVHGGSMFDSLEQQIRTTTGSAPAKGGRHATGCMRWLAS